MPRKRRGILLLKQSELMALVGDDGSHKILGVEYSHMTESFSLVVEGHCLPITGENHILQAFDLASFKELIS